MRHIKSLPRTTFTRFFISRKKLMASLNLPDMFSTLPGISDAKIAASTHPDFSFNSTSQPQYPPTLMQSGMSLYSFSTSPLSWPENTQLHSFTATLLPSQVSKNTLLIQPRYSWYLFSTRSFDACVDFADFDVPVNQFYCYKHQLLLANFYSLLLPSLQSTSASESCPDIRHTAEFDTVDFV